MKTIDKPVTVEDAVEAALFYSNAHSAPLIEVMMVVETQLCVRACERDRRGLRSMFARELRKGHHSSLKAMLTAYALMYGHRADSLVAN